MLESMEVARLEKLYERRRKRIFAKIAGCGAVALICVAVILYLTLSGDTSEQIAQNSSITPAVAPVTQEVVDTKPEKVVEQKEPKKEEIDEEQLKADLKSQIKEELKEEQAIAELKEKTRLKYELERARKYRQELEEEDVGQYFSKERDVVYEELPQKRVAQNVINTEPATPRQAPKKSKGVAQISSITTPPSLATLETNFEHTKDPKDALALAQKYYEQKDYTNAAKWAFELNSLDKSNPNGWLIFAKSKYKSGNKKDAIKVLEVYKNRASNANEITSLLTKMQSGVDIE